MGFDLGREGDSPHDFQTGTTSVTAGDAEDKFTQRIHRPLITRMAAKIAPLGRLRRNVWDKKHTTIRHVESPLRVTL